MRHLLPLLVACFFPFLAPAAAAQDYAKLSPFDGLRWRGEEPEVQLEGTWYGLVAMDGRPATQVREFCQKTWPSKWQKRFGEDLIEALTLMGEEPGRTMDLVLKDLESGVELERKGVPMTSEKRNRIRDGGTREARDAAQPDFRSDSSKISAFRNVRWNGGAPEVDLEGRWYALLSVQGLGVDRVLRFCRDSFGSSWEKRFTEDLVEVLGAMDRRPSGGIDLVLRDLESGEEIRRSKVPMSAANRASIMAARRGAPPVAGPRQRVERAPVEEVPEELVQLFHAPWMDHPVAGWASPRLEREQVEEDLAELEWLLEDRFSYLEMKGVDHRAALDALRLTLRGSLSRHAFAIQVRKLLALFGDGHTRVDESESRFLPPGYAPFLLGEVGDRQVAFLPDRSALLDPERPYLVAIDGVPLERWIAAASKLVAAGSGDYVRRRSVRLLRYVEYLRLELGLPTGEPLALTMEGEGGERRERFLEVSPEKPNYGVWPRRPTGAIGAVGYLRIPGMESDPAFLEHLHAAMDSFRGTRGLVIDVRGNGGGSRAALRELLPYFLAPEDPPRVVNVAAYKLRSGDRAGATEGYLDNRWLFPTSSTRWSRAEREAVERHEASFRPEWQPPGSFSAWHHFALAAEGAPYHYERPVKVLLDTDCFSATDIFLAAFQGVEGVELVGSPSGGGSGCSQGVDLAHSGLRLRLSSMASYRADGRLYDGRGVEPDRVVEPRPGDFVGQGDAVLEAALESLR